MTTNEPRILIVDDEEPIRRFLRVTLGSNGYRTEEAETALEALRSASVQPPDLILLDLGLPDIDGLEVTRRLRTWTPLPIIVLSARGQEDDKIAALDAGADDYLTKPFGVNELMARIRVALRHAAHRGAGAPAETLLTAGELRVDLEQRQVSVAGREVHLTPTEFQLLVILLRHAGKVVTHRQLLHDVWGPAYHGETQYLRVYMGQLRQKLEAEPARPRYILTEPGIGYRLRSE